MGRGSGQQAPTPAGFAPDLASLGLAGATRRDARPDPRPTGDAALVEGLREQLRTQTEEERRELDYAFHDLLPPSSLGAKAREAWQDIQRQRPEATRVATATAWTDAGYRVPSHIKPISVVDADGHTSLLYDIGDVVQVRPRRKPKSTDATEVLLGKAVAVADAYGLNVFRGGLVGSKDPARLAMRKHVHGALLRCPDSPAVLARASYVDETGRRREQVFVATHKGLTPEVEAQAVMMRLVRHLLNEEMTDQRAASPALDEALGSSSTSGDYARQLDARDPAMPEYAAATAARRARRPLALDDADERKWWWQWSRSDLARETLAATITEAICQEEGVKTADGPLARLATMRGGQEARETLAGVEPELVEMIGVVRRKLNGDDLYVSPETAASTVQVADAVPESDEEDAPARSVGNAPAKVTGTIKYVSKTGDEQVKDVSAATIADVLDKLVFAARGCEYVVEVRYGGRKQPLGPFCAAHALPTRRA